ncbi:hypothetical protein KP79_PYT06915 [Mizuhopecten yessoensis]|uniref:G-protein coupled receptors family 1 profile domain-containing protein n=2 Tax=Mizuhopecten yessoensis TaxID=6573 RepID=A0A210Q7K6_MIZYE|nr:hypothetical protein KP79_PYT06915 [Mizuhopecten yessoensis]
MANVTEIWQPPPFPYDGNLSTYNMSDPYYYYPPNYSPPLRPRLPLKFIHAIMTFQDYGLPILFTTGVVFNVIAITVAMRTELKKVATFLYIVALCIIDTVYLTTKMVHWGSARVYNINNVAGICQIVYYCHFLTTFLEWWMIVCLLMERVTMLYNPAFARRVCNPFRTKCALITICIFAIVAHLYHTWTSAVLLVHGGPMCTIIPENARDVMLLRKIDSVFSMILPSCTIILLILLAVVKITCCKSNKQRSIRSLNSSVSIRSRRSSHVQIQSEKSYLLSFDPKKFTETRRLSFYALSISFLFMILCLPHDFIKTRLTLVEGSSLSTIYQQLIFQLLSEIYTVNFAYKGLFCFIAIPEFRRALVALIKRILCCCLDKNDFSDECKHTVV